MFDANDECPCATARASQLAGCPLKEAKGFLRVDYWESGADGTHRHFHVIQGCSLHCCSLLQELQYEINQCQIVRLLCLGLISLKSVGFGFVLISAELNMLKPDNAAKFDEYILAKSTSSSLLSEVECSRQ